LNKPTRFDQLKPAGRAPRRRGAGSLTRRMIGVAAIWIVVLLGVGGYALDRILTPRSRAISTRSSNMC
jgi:hypothetical protein